MPIDHKDAERLATDLIAEIAAEWTDTPNVRCVNDAGSYVFVYTLAPAEIVRFARAVKRPAVTSTFTFNPLAEAAELVASLYTEVESEKIDASMTMYIMRRDAKRRIQQMLLAAEQVFCDAMEQARITGHTLCNLESLKAYGRPDIERQLVNATVELIEQKVRERFGRISEARNPKITSFKIQTVLRKFLDNFIKTGEVPSQRQFAKALEVTPKAWRDYLTKHNLDKHEAIVKQWLEEIVSGAGAWEKALRRARKGAGSIGGGESTQGD